MAGTRLGRYQASLPGGRRRDHAQEPQGGGRNGNAGDRHQPPDEVLRILEFGASPGRGSGSRNPFYTVERPIFYVFMRSGPTGYATGGCRQSMPPSEHRLIHAMSPNPDHRVSLASGECPYGHSRPRRMMTTWLPETAAPVRVLHDAATAIGSTTVQGVQAALTRPQLPGQALAGLTPSASPPPASGHQWRRCMGRSWLWRRLTIVLYQQCQASALRLPAALAPQAVAAGGVVISVSPSTSPAP